MDEAIRLVDYPTWEKDFSSEQLMCYVPPDDVVLPLKYYSDMAKRIRDFEARPDDTWVVTFPKSGTTWTQEIVYLIGTELDFERSKEHLMDERFPFFEADLFYSTPVLNGESSVSFIERAPSPRFIKSHLPYSLLPPSVFEKKCKIIYMARNPKDTMVSFFHFFQMLPLRSFQGEFSHFVRNYFKDDKLIFSPYWNHVLSFWKRRHEPNILFLTYESAKKDLPSTARQIGEFLEKPLSPEQARLVAEHCSFQNMKENPSTNKEYWKDLGRWKDQGTDFMRKGEVGDWKRFFSPELNKEIDDWIEENSSQSGLKFLYDI